MYLLRCVKGHFYDAEENEECPYCKEMSKEAVPTVPSNKLWAMLESESGETMENQDNETTVGYYRKKDPVVGWLVCIAGQHYGEGFELKCGVNFVGRDTSMDVALTADKKISREKHMMVLYDPKEKKFTVHMGETKELVYVNKEVLVNSVEIKAYDQIEIGDSIMIFIPLCGERFDWE